MDSQNKERVPIYIRKVFYGTQSNILNSNKKEKLFFKSKLAGKHLYSNSILNAKYLRLDDSKMAK